MPEVIGAIAEKWNALGGPNSYLGQPVTDEMDFDDGGGRVSVFERGAIYFWPDTGAVDMAEMFVHFTGVNCFNDTSGPGSDEVYTVLGVSPANQAPRSLTTKTQGDMDGGDSRAEVIEIYRGQPAGITIIYQVMERDAGNPEDYKAAMQEAAGAVSAGTAELIKIIPVIGPILGPGAGLLLEKIKPTLGDWFGKLLGLGDDRIGVGTVVLSPKEMVQMAIRPEVRERNVLFKIASPNLTEDGGNYKVYFGGFKAP